LGKHVDDEYENDGVKSGNEKKLKAMLDRSNATRSNPKVPRLIKLISFIF